MISFCLDNVFIDNKFTFSLANSPVIYGDIASVSQFRS